MTIIPTVPTVPSPKIEEGKASVALAAIATAPPTSVPVSAPSAGPTASKLVIAAVVPTAPRPSSPAPVAGLGVNAANAVKVPMPKSLSRLNTSDLQQPFFRGAIYGETHMWKTTIAAHFDDPLHTLIVLTRSKEQLIPLRDQGYEAVVCTDASAARYAIQYPEQLWNQANEARKTENRPALGKLRTLVLDDATEVVNMFLEDAEVIDGKEVRDARRSYKEAGGDLRDLCRSIKAKPMNFIVVALAKVRDNPITNEETIAPDLPPSMLNFLLTELEYVFYVQPGTHLLSTDRDFITFQDTDPQTNKAKVVKRVIFGKNKVAVGRNNPLAKYEKPDLAGIWRKIQASTVVPPAPSQAVTSATPAVKK